ncbi:hypothetical protein QTP86_016089 [Hemibagrus guttatus]|nr:hypothetical protein QTP86_016089 [Hemibagrus guttatus]
MFTVIFMCLWLSLGDSMADPIEPLFTHKVGGEGDDVTLSCSYKDFSDAIYNVQWYRQYMNSKPEYLLYVTPSGDQSSTIPHGMSAKVHGDKQVDLIISSAAVSDSALYYCALQPTVTGNPAALYKNLFLC